MRTIRQALDDIVHRNPFLEFGFRHGLYNLTQLARYLKPLIAARTRKPVEDSAVTMALSRLRRELAPDTPAAERFSVEAVSVHAGLSAYAFRRSASLHHRLSEFYRWVHEREGFCTLTQGMRELTIIYDTRYREAFEQRVAAQPSYQHGEVAAVSVQFDPRYVEVPGLLYLLLQRVALQNVNLVEVSSTYTEMMLFVPEADARLVFDTLFESFLVGRR